MIKLVKKIFTVKSFYLRYFYILSKKIIIGAFVHVKQASCLVRETVLNASRAYRNAHIDCERPNKHREKVFDDTKGHFKHLNLSKSITQLYAPSSNC